MSILHIGELSTSDNDGTTRIKVEQGDTCFWEGRGFRLSLPLNVPVTDVVLKFSSTVDFILISQLLDTYQGGITLEAWRADQVTEDTAFNTTVEFFSNNFMSSTPAYTSSVNITTGGSITTTGSAVETITSFSNESGTGPSAKGRSTAGVSTGSVRGLAAGDYYLSFRRSTGVTVDGLGEYQLLWHEYP